MEENELGRLISFVQGLQAHKITFALGCSRDAIMVTIPFPDRYLEAEFFADGHVEVQTFGPPASDVIDWTAGSLLDAVVDHRDSETGPTLLETGLEAG